MNGCAKIGAGYLFVFIDETSSTPTPNQSFYHRHSPFPLLFYEWLASSLHHAGIDNCFCLINLTKNAYSILMLSSGLDKLSFKKKHLSNKRLLSSSEKKGGRGENLVTHREPYQPKINWKIETFYLTQAGTMSLIFCYVRSETRVVGTSLIHTHISHTL